MMISIHISPIPFVDLVTVFSKNNGPAPVCCFAWSAASRYARGASHGAEESSDRDLSLVLSGHCAERHQDDPGSLRSSPTDWEDLLVLEAWWLKGETENRGYENFSNLVVWVTNLRKFESLRGWYSNSFKCWYPSCLTTSRFGVDYKSFQHGEAPI